MLNEVNIEGYVSGRPWTHSGDTFFRLGSYRDRQRPAKPSAVKENRDEPDYITVRIRAGGLPLAIESGMMIRVHGFLQSRYIIEPLGEFVKNAKGPTNMLSISDELRRDVVCNRVANEIVVERVVILSAPAERAERKNGKKQPESVDRRPEAASQTDPAA